MVARAPLKLAPSALVAELTRLLGETDPSEAVLAFDGDGTLWSGDVGEDLFRLATARGFLLDEALPAMRLEAAKYGIDAGVGDANAAAARLLAAYLAGVYPERDTCGMMAWCYAGHTLAAVQELARAALELHDIHGRLIDELQPVFEWSRGLGVRSVVVSASPWFVVEAAAASWSFSANDITAATARVSAGKVVAELARPVPYAEAKCTAARALFGEARWLASFGDNVFDIEMLLAAELGVAIRPKPKLQSELVGLGIRVLTPPE